MLPFYLETLQDLLEMFITLHFLNFFLMSMDFLTDVGRHDRHISKSGVIMMC